jgi:glycosyltransferase involved in cell wall biosynthesis
MKLAVFSGQYFWFDGEQYSTDEAFVKFVTAFHPYFEKIVFCDAVRRERKTQAYVLDAAKTEVCPLPFFDIYSFWKNIVVVFPKIYRVIRDGIGGWDIVWLHAPHPVSLIFAYICKTRQNPFFLFIRQDLKAYVSWRNRGLKKIMAVSFAVVLEYLFRRLSQYTLTFTVGSSMFHRYKKQGRMVCQTAVSLVSEKDLVHAHARPMSHSEGDKIKLLTVGRLDPEKGGRFLVEAMDLLIARGPKNIFLRVAGNGREEGWLQEEVDRRGLKQHVRFLGYVHHGPDLLALYKESDIFVLPSLTEGLPQTLLEAMACEVAIVATRVGGVPGLIRDGKNGLLVNPGSAREICLAVERIINDHELRGQLARGGRETVRHHTLEAERRRILGGIQRFLKQVARMNRKGGTPIGL